MGARIDKWLWSVRIYKTRTLAGDMCKSGKVRINDNRAKASTEVKINDVVHVKKNGFDFQFKALEIIQKRVGAPIAITCYSDLTPEDELRKYEAWYIGKSRPEIRQKGEGRPTKKQRREIDEFKEGYFDEDDFE